MIAAPPQQRLDGLSVAVVGASRGLGAAIAIASALAGAARLFLLGRRPEAIAPVAEEVEEAGADAEIVPCDVTSASSVEKAFEAVDTLDILVHSAGANQPEPFVEVKQETLDRLLSLNVRGAFLTAQQAARKMLAAKRGGSMVIVSSQMGHVGAPNRSVYCTTKHAIEGMVKALAVELGPHGIRVVSVAPTFVRTEMTAAQLDDPEIGPELLAQIPLGRFGETAEVASAVVFAASPAASLMTGSSLLVDGGWTAR
jgi:NAD(P)-dependent dehydrogenase (short-subunit alcohol dehydrogenase family)